ACFLRYCLFTTTDQLILMVQRRIADLWRQAAADVPATVNWAAMYKNSSSIAARHAWEPDLTRRPWVLSDMEEERSSGARKKKGGAI
uniref:hypothetical protein n=1 Tax=Listeria seeligeri TaxID=1640 RepID=UPI0022EA327A